MKIAVFLFCFCSVVGRTQIGTLSVIDSIATLLKTFDSTAVVFKNSENELTWLQIDVFTKNYYGLIRGAGPTSDTLTIKLRFETDWDSLRIEQVKVQNRLLITEMSAIYMHYMDSIEWRGYKITKTGYESDVVGHLKRKYPVPFTPIEKSKIDQIERCPDFLYQGIGIFLTCHNYGIQEEAIRSKYIHKLEYISTTLFGTEEVNYGKKHYN